MALNSKQQAAADRIRERILDARYGHTKDSYEIKRFEIHQRADLQMAFLVVETGLKNDEGTAASILCRDYRHILLGVKGGVELLNPKRKGRTINRGMLNVLHNLVK